MNYPRAQRGFTLMELLVAITIFAILAYLAYTGVSNSQKAAQHILLKGEQFHKLQFAISLFEKDARQTIHRPVRSDYSGIKAAVASLISEKGVVLTHTGWSNPAEQLRSDLQRVQYRLDGNTLLRETWTHTDIGVNANARKTPLLDDVENFQVSYLNAQQEWQDAWPPTIYSANPTGDSEPLPLAIEITLTFKNNIAVTRLISLVQ
ncbi:MAG: type II secretion system minor pseudopilin GspJ [Gammaproteobacteria bacterium]|nr:type II secretion system minor pseudopilin GspJ [Gammaproteobacteria bacterium]